MMKIEQTLVKVGGLKLHVAEAGDKSSPAVVFLHGFPEVWYSWRHQLIAVAEAGFRAIAPDYRGHGLSDRPPEPEKTTFMDLVADLLGLLDALTLSKVFLIGKDFGATVVSMFTLLHQDRVLGFVTLCLPFMPQHPPIYQKDLPDGLCISRWNEPDRAAIDFSEIGDLKGVFRAIYIMFSKTEIPIVRKDQGILRSVDPELAPHPLPSWLTEQDLKNYGGYYRRSGFRTAIQVFYRSTDIKLDIPDSKVDLPALLIMGEKDYVMKFPGMEDYIKNEEVKQFVPNLETILIPEGSHYVQEQFPAEVNDKIISFLKSHV